MIKRPKLIFSLASAEPARAGAGAAWGLFQWGLVAVAVTAVYWFLSNLS